MPEIQLSRRAERDVRSIDGTPRKRLRRALERLADNDPALDIKSLTDHSPWRRLRAGDYRVIYRLTDEDDPVIIVARVVHRSELERAVAALPKPEDP